MELKTYLLEQKKEIESNIEKLESQKTTTKKSKELVSLLKAKENGRLYQINQLLKIEKTNKQEQTINYLKSRIKHYTKQYELTGDSEYLQACSYLENAILTIKEVK